MQHRIPLPNMEGLHLLFSRAPPGTICKTIDINHGECINGAPGVTLSRAFVCQPAVMIRRHPQQHDVQTGRILCLVTLLSDVHKAISNYARIKGGAPSPRQCIT